MSRSGYSDDHDAWDLIRWRGAVASAIRGKRGQAFLREMLVALDAIPSRELIVGELEQGGQVCALGAVGRQRGLDMHDGIDIYDREAVARLFAIPESLAAEIMYENDARRGVTTPSLRWQHVRKWVVAQLRPHRIDPPAEEPKP